MFNRLKFSLKFEDTLGHGNWQYIDPTPLHIDRLQNTSHGLGDK